MTTRYTATILHSSFTGAPTVDVGDTLADAKRNAIAAFGDHFHGAEIVIHDARRPLAAFVSSLVLGKGGGWVDLAAD